MTNASATINTLPAGGLMQLTLSLVCVVGLIFAITWLVKRFNLATPRNSRAMAVLDELALSPREKLVLVQVGDTQVLLGVGSNGLTQLTPLPSRIDMPPPAVTNSFAERLRALMQGPGGGR
jgi:flagellar protein FliO/FliZ